MTSTFVTQALREKNRQVFQTQECLVLSNQAFDDLFTAMEDSEPSEELLEAARLIDEMGIQ